jgi:hypothetical protein
VTASGVACTTTISSLSDARTQVKSGVAGTVACLAAGSYGPLELTRSDAGDVTLQAAPNSHVTVGGVSISGSHITVRGLWIQGAVDLTAGTSAVTIDHNDISTGHDGIRLSSTNCLAPNAPSWHGCQPEPPISDVTISANRIHDIGGPRFPDADDAINVGNFRHLRVWGNEIFNILPDANHADCFQSTFGGTDVVFANNYEHDNQCQGFYLDDGNVTGATVVDNLFVRGNDRGSLEYAIQIFDTNEVVIRSNTAWTDGGSVLRNAHTPLSPLPTAAVDHNVLASLNSRAGNDPSSYTLASEGFNVLAEQPWTFTPAGTDVADTSPAFLDPARDDYRLATRAQGAGVDWSPSTQQYGPTA